MPTELEHEQNLLHRLRDSDDPAALREAGHLRTIYHDRQMDGLAQDAYQAAKGEGRAPAGWTRLSEHQELIAEYAERLHTTPAELRRTLHPDISGFRAEIYLPDAAMQQAGYKPTLAIKGSSGEVMTSDGKRHDTTTEDFAANNFPQSVGLETDYYDRAMQLGYELKQAGVDFESTGHSLSGGMVAAIAAVTGTHSTTFNAAGLNPTTTERFAQQNPGVIIPKDLTHLITNYQVQGELLSDGVQSNFHNMDALRRMELGGVLKEAGDVLQHVPEARDLFAQKVGAGLSPEAQLTVNAFVNKLATGDVSSMLHDLPLAAGSQHVLAATTRDAKGHLVPRVQVTSLPEDTRLVTPLLESLAVVAAGARVGQRGGEVLATGGHLAAEGLHLTGSGIEGTAKQFGAGVHAMTRAEGAVVQAGEHALGAALANARTAQAEISARVHQGLGEAQHLGAELDARLLRGMGHFLPENAQRALQTQAERLHQEGLEAKQQGASAAVAEQQLGQHDAIAIRNATRAAEEITSRGADAYGSAQENVIGGAGHYARAVLDGTAKGIENTTRHAPAAFATLGAAAAVDFAVLGELTPLNIPRLRRAAEAGSRLTQDASEAFERHLMKNTVTPSMDAHVQSSELFAEQTLQRLTQEHIHKEQQTTEPSLIPSASAPLHQRTPAVTPPEKNYQRNAPRHSNSSDHALYNTLKERIPEASESRLVQFTAACHTGKINNQNLDHIFLNEQTGVIGFTSAGFMPTVVTVDIKDPPPQAAQSIQNMQQHDQQQTQLMVQMQAQIAQTNAQGQQGPMLGG